MLSAVFVSCAIILVGIRAISLSLVVIVLYCFRKRKGLAFGCLVQFGDVFCSVPASHSHSVASFIVF